MVMKMHSYLTFKEPETCDYIYIDVSNRVHLMLPLVGGDGIAIDNTCKTVMELRSFFHGVPSALDRLNEYRKNIEEDINYINNVQKIKSRLAHQDILSEKKERLEQVKKYIELIKELEANFDKNREISSLPRHYFPSYPAAIQELLKSSQNAFAVRLSPNETDPYTRFNNPLFNLKRNRSKFEPLGFMSIYEGLSYRLRTTLLPDNDTPTQIKKSDKKNELIMSVLNRWNANDQEGTNKLSDDPLLHEEKFNALKGMIEDALKVIDPAISLDKAVDNTILDLAYVDMVTASDENSSAKEYIEGILDCGLSLDFWDQQSTSVFYDGLKAITTSYEADRVSVKVQFLLAQINVFCKINKLSQADFGPFLDAEPQATELAKLIKEGLINGVDIEPIIHNYINTNLDNLGISAPLTEEQQKQITQRFNQDYNVIKDSPHFDEFFLVDPDQKGNVFVHQGRISCHFLDFLTLQSKGACSLGDLAGHSDALQQSPSNRLNHKNDRVIMANEELKQFKENVVDLLANNPKELVKYLVAASNSGAPNYSMLTLETQSYIAFNRNWPELAKEMIANDQIPATQKADLSKLLSRENIEQEKRISITWGNYSSKSLLEVELHKLAQGLYDTAQKYEEKRANSWWKGSRNVARHEQCASLIRVAKEVNDLFNSQTMSQEQILEKLVQSINTLNRIDHEIGMESNFFQSTLQVEVQAFRNQLKELCQIENFELKTKNAAQTISIDMANQLNKINDANIREIVGKLPAHCHTNGAIDLFNTLTPQEALKVASYLRIEYRELDASVDKDTLLSTDIPALFKVVNLALLADLLKKGTITEEAFQKLEQIAETIRPELFTEKNIVKLSENIQVLENSKIGEILIEVGEMGTLIDTKKHHLSEPQIGAITKFAERLKKTTEEQPEEVASLPPKVKKILTDFEGQMKNIVKPQNDAHASYREKMQALRAGEMIQNETESFRM